MSHIASGPVLWIGLYVHVGDYSGQVTVEKGCQYTENSTVKNVYVMKISKEEYNKILVIYMPCSLSFNLSLSLSSWFPAYRCVVPEVVVETRCLDFNQCFLGHRYTHTARLANISHLPACYELLDQVNKKKKVTCLTLPTLRVGVTCILMCCYTCVYTVALFAKERCSPCPNRGGAVVREM